MAIMFSVVACDSAVSPRVVPPAPNGGLLSPWQLPVLPTASRVAVVVSPDEFSVGQSANAIATAFNEAGETIAAGSVVWSSEDPSVAAVEAGGTVRGMAAGSTRIVATIGSTVGFASVTVNQPSVEPSHTVTSVSVSLSRTTLSVGETAVAVATAREASGAVVTGQPVNWRSSNPRVATVSGQGAVSALSSGMAAITATVGEVSGETTVNIETVDVPDFGNSNPSVGHPNEPGGFAQLSPTLTGDVLPPTQNQFVAGSPNEMGWIRNNISQVVDPSSPEGSSNVLQIPFPAGAGNGTGPGMAYTMSSTNPQHWPSGPTEIYLSYWYKVSPNFPASLNAGKMMYGQIGNENGTVGNKLVYLINGNADWKFSGAVDASPPVFAPNEGTPYNTPLFPTITVQNIISVDGNVSSAINLNQNTAPSTEWKYQRRGVWHHHEVWVKSNTPGNQDGSVRVWFDGSLIINYTDRIKWSNNPTRDKWWTMFWDPIYNNMIPLDASNAYHRLKNLYVSGR